MSGSLDLHGLALLLGRSYYTAVRDWRRWCAEDGLPEPYIGKNGKRPRWSQARVEAWRDGTSGPVVSPVVAGPQPANDPVRPEPAPRAQRLRRSLGG